MRLRIFRVTHFFDENANYMSNDIFTDFIIGQKSKENHFSGDLDSEDNIAFEDTHSEMRAHYYIWKNHLNDYDYIGFEHYRRLLYVDYIPYSLLIKNSPSLLFLRKEMEKDRLKEIFHNGISFNDCLNLRKKNDEQYNNFLKEKIAQYDIFCVRSQNISTKSDFCNDELLEHVFASCSYFANKPMLVDFNHTTTNYRCSFIMRRDYFDEFMTLWYEVVTTLSKILYNRPREIGYYSEKIFSYYLFQKRMENPLIRVSDVPMLAE